MLPPIPPLTGGNGGINTFSPHFLLPTGLHLQSLWRHSFPAFSKARSKVTLRDIWALALLLLLGKEVTLLILSSGIKLGELIV